MCFGSRPRENARTSLRMGSSVVMKSEAVCIDLNVL